MDSSVAFESLYFVPKIVLAYHHPEEDLPDPEYNSYLNLFSNEEELNALLAVQLPALKPKDGRDFFKSKYGIVDGNEVERIEELRGWKKELPGSQDAPIYAGTVNSRPIDFLHKCIYYY